MDLSRNLIQRVNVGDSLTRSAATRPSQTAVVDGERRWTYAELEAWANRLAHGLLARGYARGNALALASGNSAEFLAAYYACAKVGVVCVPVNLGWRPDEVAYVLGHSQARGMVVEAQLVATMAPAIEKVSDVVDVLVAPGTGASYEATPADRSWSALDDVLAADTTPPEVYVEDRDALSYLYTSGTTSFPKGVESSHLAITMESMSTALDSGWGHADRFLCLMPLFHTAQLNAFCTPAVLVGATMYLHRGFDPEAFLATIERERITQVFALPMMYRAALEHPSFAGTDVSTLKRAVYAMAPMPDALMRAALEGFDCDFALLFGQTEMNPCTTLHRPENQLTHIGSVGTALTGVQVAVMSPDGELLGPNEPGEIVYRGPSAMNGYLHNPEATATAFAHGWFHSGDVGYVADDGVLWFTDRYKDVIKTGGENVASIEVEKAVYAADPRIAEAVVVGLPHARWSEAITAVVVPKPGETLDPAELTATLRTLLDGYKVPKAVIVADELPKTSTGKIQKNVVRDAHTAHYEGGLMAVLRSTLDTASEDHLQNRKVQLAAIAALDEQLELAVAGGGERYMQRHRDRGKLPVRERLELLLDPDSPFLELSPLAAWGTGFTVGATVLTGIGVVSGVECMVIGHDPTVRGGAMNPYSLRKTLRALEIARLNRLPVINLVESGGADLPTQAELFVPAGRIFHELTELSGLGIPTVALVFGNSTAGGAYVPGMCDYAVLVDRGAKVFLGGPPLVKMATGEESDDESLGGAEMHSRVSGLSDYFAVDEYDAIRLGREILTRINWRKLGPAPSPHVAPPLYDPDEILGILPPESKVPFDPREILARTVDGSEFDEYKPLYGTSIVTGWARIHGYPVGVLANHRGVLFSEEAKKATEFILLANQTDTPLVFLQNTTGYMVGAEYEQGGIIKDGAKMINAVTNSTVPHLTVNMASSFGAGNYGMSGRAYDPRLMFAWPNAKLAVMGAAQLAGVMSIVGKASAEAQGKPFDTAADAERTKQIEAQIEEESHAFYVTARLYDDGIIDPRDTRTVLGMSLSAVHNQVVQGRRGFGVFRM